MQNGIDFETYQKSVFDGLVETSTYAYYETKNYYVGKELRRFAHKNGMSLAELNALLTVGSLAGNAIAGSRYQESFNGKVDLIDGIGRRSGGLLDWTVSDFNIAGAPFEVIDFMLGTQGVLTASGSEYIKNRGSNNLLVGYSLGALDVSNLTARGHSSNSLSISLPFGNVGMSTSTVNGTFDPVNGGPLGVIFTPRSNWENKGIIDHRTYNYDAFNDSVH